MKKFFAFLLALALMLTSCISAVACTEYCGTDWDSWYDWDEEDDEPTNDELRNAALGIINQRNGDIRGLTARVIHAGNLRQSYSGNSRKLATAYRGDEFTILGYKSTGPLSLWLQVQSPIYGTGWILASMVEIDCGIISDWYTPAPTGGSRPTPTPGNQGLGGFDPTVYINMCCEITVSSARARAGAGTNYPIVEYVGKGREFTIGNACYGTDGKIWFQIVEDGNVCWISSGVAEVEGYAW